MRANGDSSGVRRPPLANSVSSQARPDTNESLSARVNANYYSKNRRTTHTHKPAHTQVPNQHTHTQYPHTRTQERKKKDTTHSHTQEREREREREEMHARHSSHNGPQSAPAVKPIVSERTITIEKTFERIRHSQKRKLKKRLSCRVIVLLDACLVNGSVHSARVARENRVYHRGRVCLALYPMDVNTRPCSPDLVSQTKESPLFRRTVEPLRIHINASRF